MSEKYKITFEVYPTEGKDQIIKLLQVLRSSGIVGASREFGMKDPVNEVEEEWSFFFDGDGNHRLDNIEVEEL